MAGWMGGWVGGWIGDKTVLRIAYINQQSGPKLPDGTQGPNRISS